MEPIQERQTQTDQIFGHSSLKGAGNELGDSWSLPPASQALLSQQAQLEAQKATQDFQRATEVLRAAKETISLAEQRLLEDDKRQFDSAWQEMLNHATQRVGGPCVCWPWGAGPVCSMFFDSPQEYK